jgi:hypothetical protein
MRVFGTYDFLQSRFPYKRIKTLHEGVEKESIVGAPFCLWSIDGRGNVTNVTKTVGNVRNEFGDIFLLADRFGSYKDFNQVYDTDLEQKIFRLGRKYLPVLCEGLSINH